VSRKGTSYDHKLINADTSHLIVSATTILLRCAVEVENLSTKHALTTKLVQLHIMLKKAWIELEWDLAKFCLERCGDAIDKLSQYLHIDGEDKNPRQTQASPTDRGVGITDDIIHVSSLIEPDFFFPVDSLDYAWENLWCTFEGPWPISI
jgi:hypothetical protein